MTELLDRVLDHLDALVGFDTTSDRSNLALVDWLEERLAAAGATTRRLPNDSGTKANLLARVGPAAEGGIVLSGHTDCVPVEGQPWSSDPFRLQRGDGHLTGRGVTDMKGFLAVLLAVLEDRGRTGLSVPIHLALSRDEEVGALGAAELVPELLTTEPQPAIAVVGEPTSMRIVNAHKGVRAFTTTVAGRDAHSSQPQRGANAVVAAARIATFIDDLAAAQADGPTDPRFDPPYTTMNVATVRGGQAINIIPRRCELTWEYRPVPSDDHDGLQRRVEEFAAAHVLPGLADRTDEAAITTVVDSILPTLASEPDGAAERLVRELTGNTDPADTAPFGTDGGHFQRAGISTVVCGPGAIEDAHQPNETIAVAELEACVDFVQRVWTWAGGAR